MRYLVAVLQITSIVLLASCGESNTNRGKVTGTGSSDSTTSQSSSNSSEDNIKIDFIYPTYKSNLGGVDTSKVIVGIADSSNIGEVTGINIDGLELNKLGNHWVLPHGDLNLLIQDDLSFDITVSTAKGTYIANPLNINNSVSGISGIGESFIASGISFNQKGNELYFSDSFKGQVQVLDLLESTRQVIYQGVENTTSTKPHFWPMDFDPESGTIHFVSDKFAFSEVSSKDQYIIEYNELTREGFIVNSYISPDNVQSVRSLVLDFDFSILGSQDNKTAYLVDFLSDQSIHFLVLEGELRGESYALSNSGNSNTELSSAFSPSAVIEYQNSLLVARQFDAESNISDGSIVRVLFESGPFGPRPVYTQFSDLSNSIGDIQKPTAMALNQDQTTLYIADQDKIWAMDLTQESKPFELLTSSSIIPGKKGQGPRLGSSITAMEVHPEHDVLYIAAGAQGIMAVDLETGDRITVAK